MIPRTITHRGFSLVELVLVVAILVRGIVARCREMDREHAHLIAAEAPATNSPSATAARSASWPVS